MRLAATTGCQSMPPHNVGLAIAGVLAGSVTVGGPGGGVAAATHQALRGRWSSGKFAVQGGDDHVPFA